MVLELSELDFKITSSFEISCCGNSISRHQIEHIPGVARYCGELEHAEHLPLLVMREVDSKLNSGLKNPRRT